MHRDIKGERRREGEGREKGGGDMVFTRQLIMVYAAIALPIQCMFTAKGTLQYHSAL